MDYYFSIIMMGVFEGYEMKVKSKMYKRGGTFLSLFLSFSVSFSHGHGHEVKDRKE